jgi:hypothetical protein
MHSGEFHFDIPYTDDTIRGAAKAFVQNGYSERFLKWYMLVAQAIFVAGFGYIAFFSPSATQRYTAGAMLFFFLAHIVWTLFIYPRLIASALRKRLHTTERVSLTPDGIVVHGIVPGRLLQWWEIKKVVEFRSFFLLLPRHGFGFVPKLQMPAEAQAFLRAASLHRGKFVNRENAAG